MAPFRDMVGKRPENVGIHAMEVYFPRTAVSQKELEKDFGVKEGK